MSVAIELRHVGWRPPDTAIACNHMRWAVHRALISVRPEGRSLGTWAQRNRSDYFTLSAFGRLIGDRECPTHGDDSLIAVLTDARLPGTFDASLDEMVTAISPPDVTDLKADAVKELVRKAGFHRK